MNNGLFDPLKLKSLELQNRIIVSPMCQYSADEGIAGDWHIMHIGQFATANPGLIFLEGTAVMAEGRISPQDLCLYNDEQEDGIRRLVDFVHQHSESKIGMQLFHSGRKGSQHRPWSKNGQWDDGETIPLEKGGWSGCAPSAIRYDASFRTPVEASPADLEKIKSAFVESAKRADRAGIDTIELHYAHGYLLHTFLSSVSNHRTDNYGGSLENRMRFPLEVFQAVRAVWPDAKPLGGRISGTDFGLDVDAWTLEDAIIFAQALEASGCDYLDVSAGFLSPNQELKGYGPGFQVPLAARIKSETRVPTLTVGAIVDPVHADQVIRDGDADAVAIARGMLYDPRWPWHAAHALGETPKGPPQYERTFAMDFPEMFNAKKGLS